MSESQKMMQYANGLVFGGKPMDSIPPEWQATVIAYLGRWIFEKARDVLRGRTLEDRRDRLAAVPVALREHVEAEARRQHSLSRQQ